MQLPFISRRHHEQLVARLDADRERLRGERNQFRQDRDAARRETTAAARRFTTADAAVRRLAGRNLELGRRLATLAESDPEHLAQLDRRVRRLRTVGTRILAAYFRERRRADHLQGRLDDALGLNRQDVRDGSLWQYSRRDKGTVRP
ncbi:hypothetical protein [Streptomyces acidiscabies]|uniref:hypothetical protein n=1 Tax=Streptomyces acidiscabies TaxID=42234 RepID=UPI000952FA89|nr:hypothetical protein [Streptomyces acidiscabies]